MKARIAACTAWGVSGTRKAGSMILTSVDGKIEDIHPKNGHRNDGIVDEARFTIYTEGAEEASDHFLGPGEAHQRHDGGDGATKHEGLPLSPSNAAVVTQHTDIGLYESARKGTSNPDECHDRLGDAQREQIR